MEFKTAFPYKYKLIPAAITINKAQGTVTILNLSEVLPAGVYDVSFAAVAKFTSKGDSLKWWTTGILTSPIFNMTSVTAAEVSPVSYKLPIVHAGGAMNLSLLVSLSGSVNSSVNIERANIVFHRVG